jgi:hypothetical protein
LLLKNSHDSVLEQEMTLILTSKFAEMLEHKEAPVQTKKNDLDLAFRGSHSNHFDQICLLNLFFHHSKLKKVIQN